MLTKLRAEKIPIQACPVSRKGAIGRMRSVYFRDSNKMKTGL